MSKTTLTFFLWILFSPATFSQNVAGGRALKRIEHKFKNNVTVILPNGKIDGVHNLDSKTDLEKLFFGDINAQIEFFVSPSFNGATGFRIVKDSSNKSYIIDIKYISNFEDIKKQLDEEFHLIGIPAELFFSMPDDIKKLIKEHNDNMYPKRTEAKLNRYKIATLSFPVSDFFVKKLYAKFVSTIGDFKAKGKPAVIFDGTTITFRCIAEDEVWTLTVHEPQGDIQVFSDLCKRIIEDAEAGRFDESKYIGSLEN